MWTATQCRFFRACGMDSIFEAAIRSSSSPSEPGSLIGVVLAGFVEDLGPTAVSSLLGDVRRALADGGVAVVVTGDPADRNAVERDLRAGRGLAPATWAHLLERAGFDVEITPVDNDPRIGSIVVGRLG